MPNETLRTELHEARDHAKEAARATLLAVRSAIDFAINKLDPGEHPADASTESNPPEQSATAERPDATPAAAREREGSDS